MRTGKEENFWIWDQVKNTNPKYTKAFTKFGGKELTTIDPMYQIQVMTGMFGPVGLLLYLVIRMIKTKHYSFLICFS